TLEVEGKRAKTGNIIWPGKLDNCVEVRQGAGVSLPMPRGHHDSQIQALDRIGEQLHGSERRRETMQALKFHEDIPCKGMDNLIDMRAKLKSPTSICIGLKCGGYIE